MTRASGAYPLGSWTERLSQMRHDWLVNNADGYFVVLLVLAWFLAGVWLWRSGFLPRLKEHGPLLRWICAIGLVCGVCGSMLALSVKQSWQPRVSHRPGLLVANLLLRLGSGTALSLGHAACIALLTLTPALPRFQRGLKAAGRTALSNYILQSVIGTSIHYGHGFGMYGRVGAVQGFLFSVAVFVIQMPVSVWYLSCWRVGPPEWLWRRISYGRPPRPGHRRAESTA